ncbi:MAG: hypothetical protein RLZZ461_624 [Planctomycetota bacterium]
MRDSSSIPSAATVADAAVAAVRLDADERDLAQDVRGVDALSERDLQSILARGFEVAGLHPLREVRFPHRAGEPIRSVGTRCDFVLRPREAPLDLGDADDLDDADDDHGPGLFDDVDPPPPPPATLDPTEALWLEVKSGSACRDFGDAGDLATLPRRLTLDLARLAHARGLRETAALIVAFGPDEETLAHDAHELDRHAASQGLPTRGAIVRTFPITDRHGNAAAVIAVIPVGRG